MTRILITPEFRMSYPKLIVAEQYIDQKTKKPKGDPKHSLQMIFPNDDLDKFKVFNEDAGEFEDVDIRKVCVQVAKEEWPDIDVKEACKHGGMKWPIKNGDTLAAELEARKKTGDHYKGCSVITPTASQEFAPSLYVNEGGKRKQLVRGIDADERKGKQLFDTGGNYAYGEVTVKAYEVDEKKFIKFYINAVVFLRAGERLGGTSLMDRFEGTMGGESEVDPTEGLDDEIPF